MAFGFSTYYLSKRLSEFLEGVAMAAEFGHKDLDRLSLAQERLRSTFEGEGLDVTIARAD